MMYYQLSSLVGHKRKFTPAWRGVWKIEKMFGSNAALIRELVTEETKKVNVDKLKRIRWTMDQEV